MSSKQKGTSQWGYNEDQINKLKEALTNPENAQVIIAEIAKEKGVTPAAVGVKYNRMRKDAVSLPGKKKKKYKRSTAKKAAKGITFDPTTGEGRIPFEITKTTINPNKLDGWFDFKVSQ